MADSPDSNLLHDIYIDESSQTKNRYLLLGGIIIPTNQVAAANECLGAARLPELPAGEIKWGKASRSKLAAYERYADAFFDEPALSSARFHSLIVDTRQLDHARFNLGSKEIGFNKEIYQLATKFAKLNRQALFHLYPDHRDTPSRPNDLRDILNHGQHKSGDRRDWPFRRCQFRDSSKVPLLQLVDILLGSVAFGKNGHASAPNVSPVKLALGRRIMRKAGIRSLDQDTARDGKFTVWHRKLR